MPKTFTAGDFRERFDLQAGTVASSNGVDTTTWAAVAGWSAVPAHVRYETEGERIRAGRNEARETIVVTIRDASNITPQHRIVWQSAAWQVLGFPAYVDVRQRFQKFTAVRTDANPSPS
jgi:SPP1 family predicted phage head-tail adaptor